MRRTWTEAEDDRLVDLLRGGATIVEAAPLVGRSERACSNRLIRLRADNRPVPDTKMAFVKRLDTRRSHPLVKRVIKRAVTEGFSMGRLAKAAGIAHGTLRHMIDMPHPPNLGNFEAVANAVGYRIKLVSDDDEREAA